MGSLHFTIAVSAMALRIALFEASARVGGRLMSAASPGGAYSRHQGWVEGALATAEQVLRDHFGIAAPAFTPCDRAAP